jgi:glycosyltransferase involved in cell wall biosynthesis
MKVLVVTGIFPPDHGGPATFVPVIAEALAQRDSLLGVVTLSDVVESEVVFPYRVVRILRGEGRLRRIVRTILLIRALARTADIVFLNGLVLEGVIACKLLSSRPVVVKVVGDLIWEQARRAGVCDSLDAFQDKSQALRWVMLKMLQGWYMQKADRIIVPSRYLARIVSKWGVSPERISVIYNSVQRPVQNEEYESNQKPDVDLVTVARLVPWKGLSELISMAFTHGWSLRIVGDGPLRTELEMLVLKMGASQLVSFAGHVQADKVASEIQRGRVFVLNSSYEGLPHVILEAKAAGVPVVATDVGGTSETIQPGINGYLVTWNDQKSLIAPIKTLLADAALRSRIADAGRRQVAESFSSVRMVQEIIGVLSETAGVLEPG